MKLRFRLSFFLCALYFSCFAGPGVSGAGNTAFAFELKAGPVLWDRLTFRAKSLFGQVTTDVRLKSVKVEDGVELLISEPAGEALQPTGTSLFKLTVDSNIDPLFGGAEILNTQSWFEPDCAAALQRIRLRFGQDKWQKSYRFTKKGVFRLRKKPKDSGEDNLAIDQWTKIRTHFYGYGDPDPSCSQILEPASLLYVVSAITLAKAPNPLRLCVFNKKQLHRLTVSADGSGLLKVNFLERRAEGVKRVARKIDTVKISFQPRSLAPADMAPEKFSFLGLKGAFVIYIDKASRVPVQVSGRISAFGKVDIKLQEVNLTPEDS